MVGSTFDSVITCSGSPTVPKVAWQLNQPSPMIISAHVWNG